MKKTWLTGIFASVLVLGACGGNGSEETGGSEEAGGSGDTIEWSFGHLADENHIWHQTAERFAELVEENSDGQMEITIYPNNSLGGETDTINAIQAGTADMVISGETLQNWAPNAALMAVPYAFRDLEHVQNVVEGEIGQQIKEEIAAEADLTALYYHTRAPRNLTSNEPIESPEDLNGFSMRVPNVPLFLDVWEAAGASPQVMDFNEVFTGLQQGVIDGQENPVDLIQSAAFYEVQDYVNRTEHVYSWIYILVGNEQYNALSDELKEVVQSAAEEAQAYGEELYNEEIETIEQELKDEGMEFVDVDQDAFRAAMTPAVEASLTPEQLELYEQILAVE
ncbi:TRAP transporter substrate-binding protein [Planococcus halotolerans]|uniref:TRAP transporter substrate-binding protein n=1 Tax=Planococcus halotolerans TaxID=2233542 RepID=UPI0010931365|nr:TRAP transporter substrate-binding protein [Planococcus halotolerans]QHJ70098.1 DctP family TRAP transporter solute-binding subunit [Planococcus halotolerans]